MKSGELYTLRELLQLNETSTKDEFKPKVGDKVESGNKKNKKDAEEITKTALAYDKAGQKEKTTAKRDTSPDYNRNNMEWFYTTSSDGVDDVPDSYKKRVKKLATVGTESDMADCYDTTGNEKFYNDRKKVFQNRVKDKELDAKSGLKGKEYHKAGYDFKPKSVYESVEECGLNDCITECGDMSMDAGLEGGPEGRHTDMGGSISPKVKGANRIPQMTTPPVTEQKTNRPTKRLVFKNTTFLSEAQVLQRVPDEYKLDENKFYMQDKTGTDYLVECKSDPFGFIHMEITNKLNKKEINEQLEKIKRLSSYSYGDDNVKVDRTKLEDMSESISNFKKLLK